MSSSYQRIASRGLRLRRGLSHTGRLRRPSLEPSRTCRLTGGSCGGMPVRLCVGDEARAAGFLELLALLGRGHRAIQSVVLHDIVERQVGVGSIDHLVVFGVELIELRLE